MSRPSPAPCPATPNCISTKADRPAQTMSPLSYRVPESELMSILHDCIRSTRGARILEEREGYLHVECRSRWFGFQDDVEFFIDSRKKELHFRSASRVGYWDLGANRRRMEAISRELARYDGIRLMARERVETRRSMWK